MRALKQKINRVSLNGVQGESNRYHFVIDFFIVFQVYNIRWLIRL